jgi:signal transduction histidine kinase
MRLLPTLRLQLAALVVAAVCVPLLVVLSSGWVMLDMHVQWKIVAVALASAFVGLACVLLLARRILRPLEALRAASSELAAGNLAARATSSGSREVHEVGAAFNEMATNIEQLFDARRELVAWASHDLRTPIAALRAMVEALEDGLATPEEYLPAINDQLRILASLVDDLFEVTLLDAGAITLDLRDAPLDRLIESSLDALRPEAEQRGIGLESRGAAAGVPVRMAPAKVERVLLNLLSNALRHTPDGGTVAVLVEANGDHVRVAVEDTGKGISQLAEQRMFDLFWREDESRTRETGGAGVGLAVAEGVVRAHGGTIWAENRSAGGARVAFTLQRANVIGSGHAVPVDSGRRRVRGRAARPGTRGGRTA